jgi:heme exporter protein CcmD
MIEHDPHTGFIIAAYAIATFVIVSMIVVIVADHRALRANLKRFGARGLDARGADRE